MKAFSLDGEWLAARQLEAAAHWAQTLANDCPRCALSPMGKASFDDCRYKESERCKLTPEIQTLAQIGLRYARLKAARAPKRYWSALCEGGILRETKALAHVRRLLAGEGGLLVLGGPAGSGKSFAASHAIAERGGMFVPAADLARPLNYEPGESDPIAAMKRARVLVIDDVGDEHSPGGFAGSMIRELVRHREHDELPTIITTNLPEAVLDARLTERFSSRVAGDQLGYRACVDADLRRAP
jgi:DNA replication protein DnaC